jgi:hypothetical protein
MGWRGRKRVMRFFRLMLVSATSVSVLLFTALCDVSYEQLFQLQPLTIAERHSKKLNTFGPSHKYGIGGDSETSKNTL